MIFKKTILSVGMAACLFFSGTASAVGDFNWGWVKHDCGWTTCTFRYNWRTTNNYAASVFAINSAPPCAFLACRLTASLLTGLASTAIARNKCLGYRYPAGNPAIGWPIHVSRGTHNC